jgi:phospholipase C
MPLDPGHDFFDVLIELAGPEAVDAWNQNPGQYPPIGKRSDSSDIRIDNSGFVRRYVEKGGADPGLIMKCFGPGELPVLQQLANEFVVCDHWYSSLPGSTWPNRFFADAGSSGGLDDNPGGTDIAVWAGLHAGGFGFQHGTIYDALDRAGHNYGIFAGEASVTTAIKGVGIPDYYWNMMDDLVTAENGRFWYVHIEPDYDALSHFKGGHSQHPLGSVGKGEAFIKYVYEQIRNSPFWERSLLILTWDEHGGFYDHVSPPPAVPPGDSPDDPSHNKHGFRFDRLGVRVPAIVISPWIPKNLIDHRVYDHASIPATIERITGIDPLTNRDRYANSVTTLLTLIAPRQDTPTTLVDSLQTFRVSQPFATGPARPGASINEGEVAAFLSTAVAQDLKLSTPDEHAAIFRRVREIKTHADAWAYMKKVEQKLAARRPASALA